MSTRRIYFIKCGKTQSAIYLVIITMLGLFFLRCNKEPKEYPWHVIKEILVGAGPGGIIVLPNGEYAYVANSYDISVIRTSDNTVTATIPIGNSTQFLASLPNSEYVYVTGPNISVIRTSDNAIVDTVDIGSGAGDITALPNGEFVYVTTESDVLVIRTSDNTVIDTIPIYGGPKGIVASPAGDYVYVASWDSSVISIIRTSDNVITNTISLGNIYPSQLAVLPNGEYLYVTGTGVLVIRLSDNTVIDTVRHTGLMPGGIDVLPDGAYIYVACWESHNVSVIRVADNTVVETIETGDLIADVAIHPDGNFVYVTGTSGSKVFVIGF